MKILTNSWSRFIQNHVGDYYANIEIESLQSQYSDMNFVNVDSKKEIIFANIRSILLNLASKAGLLNKNIPLFQPFFNLQCTSYLSQKYIDKISPDVIFAHSHIPRYGNNNNIPLVAVEYLPSHHYMIMTNTYFSRERDLEAKRYATESASVVLTTTPGSLSRFNAFIPSLNEKLILAPIYMPYLESAPTELLFQKSKLKHRIKVLFVGGEARRKGLENIVKAFSFLPNSFLDKLDFVVVSKFLDGPIDGVEKFANIHSRLDSVQLAKLFRETDIFLFPTRFDTYGRVIVEAMASGCAIISSNLDPQDWILNYGEAGLLIDPESPEQIAEALITLVQNADKRIKLSFAAHRRFLDVFHHRVVGEIYRSAFDLAIKSN